MGRHVEHIELLGKYADFPFYRTGRWIGPGEVEDDIPAQTSKTTARKKPRVTKPKTANAKRRGKKLIPKRLSDLPPEAFNQISKYSMPSDLLSLARTNKFFRKMFMSRASQHLWKTAMANISNIPPCPTELSEPQYVSLIYSPTCSNCGTCVFHRRMDPYLLVRLCDSCLEEQVDEWRGDENNLQFLPQTHLIKEPQSSNTFVLKDDIQDMNTAAARAQRSFTAWKKAKSKRVKERQTFGDKLNEFLNGMGSGPKDELEQLREERWNQIKTRLVAEGWNEDDFQLRYSPEWQQLVWQPKPVTDRSWANLRSKLLPFLNRTHYMSAEQKKRRKDRIDKLQSFTRSIYNPLPPLVHVTLKLPHGEKKSTTPRSDYQDVYVHMPFPSTNEFLMWPMIRSIVGEDISPQDAETRFEAIRNEVNQAITEWRNKLEQDLIEIWNSGGEARAMAASQTSSTLNLMAHADAALRTVGKAFPEFVITYGKPDGTRTINFSELSQNMQLLLRADVMFKGEYLAHNFPDVVPRAYLGYTLVGGTEEEVYGDRWEPSKLERDNDMSAVARNLLARVGRSDASAAEMQALGRNFVCGRCHQTMAHGWTDLVGHYTTEERQSRLAQAKIDANPKSGFVYRNTHDLQGPGNANKPFAKFLTSSQAADLYEETEDYQMYMMSCAKCDEMGIPTRYFYAPSRKIDSPMLEHLRDVHGIQKGKVGVHFKPEPLPDIMDDD